MTTNKIVALVTSALIGYPISGPTQIPVVDVSGKWAISCAVSLPDEIMPCRCEGLADLNQTDNHFSGIATFKLVDGPEACPTEIDTEVDGSVDGPNISLGLLLGSFGEAMFWGSLLPDSDRVEGAFDVTTGPFTGLSGSWSGVSDRIFKDGFESTITLSRHE